MKIRYIKGLPREGHLAIRNVLNPLPNGRQGLLRSLTSSFSWKGCSGGGVVVWASGGEGIFVGFGLSGLGLTWILELSTFERFSVLALGFRVLGWSGEMFCLAGLWFVSGFCFGMGHDL